MAKPYCCPVCLGKGVVPPGFYRTGSYTTTTLTLSDEQCRSCKGTGVVWDVVAEPIPITITTAPPGPIHTGGSTTIKCTCPDVSGGNVFIGDHYCPIHTPMYTTVGTVTTTSGAALQTHAGSNFTYLSKIPDWNFKTKSEFSDD